MGPVVFPLSFCGTTAGNVIHIFFINDLLLYPFAVNQHGPFEGGRGGSAALLLLGVTTRARTNGTILMGWEDWERPPHMHLASEMNRKVDSDARSSKHAQPAISGTSSCGRNINVRGLKIQNKGKIIQSKTIQWETSFIEM